MMPDHTSYYRALCARDRRFDGRFFVGVTSTGIYCRPVCRARTPKESNCRFFAHAAAAEAAGFRPCLLCRPELAPGQAVIDAPSRLAWAAAQRIEAGFLNEQDIDALAARLHITSRHLRRVFVEALGVTPVAYAQTQRLLTAKRLLADTRLPITEVAMAAGFGSLRRFNHLFKSHYGLTPGAMRRQRGDDQAPEQLVFRLGFRPPFDWPRLLAFLAARCVRGVEEVADGEYRRSVRIGTHQGWLVLRLAAERNEIHATLSASLLPVLPAVLAGVRRLCDLAAEPQAIAAALGELAADAPGLRVPGAFDGFEMSVRAVLGQQVTVKAAHTLAGRFTEAFGEHISTPYAAINRLFPTPPQVLAAGSEAIGQLGIVRQRSGAILALAAEIDAGRLELAPVADVARTLAQLEALPGIGRWTAQYIALRALGWPDAWPSGDVALIKALGAANVRAADSMAAQWQPWRSYATLHLWRRLGESVQENKA